MALVLTEASTVTCAHGGAVTTEGASRLKVNGSGVLLEAGVVGKDVSTACSVQTNTNTGTKQCSKVASLTAGKTSKLKVDGKPVLLQSLAGTTDGLPAVPPPGTQLGTAVPKQTRLQAT